MIPVFTPIYRATAPLVCAGGLLLSGSHPAVASSRFRIPPLGADVSVFFPTSAKARDRFGSSWVQFSPGIGDLSRPVNKPTVTLAFGGYFGRRGDNRAFLLPIGVQFGIPLVRKHAVTPFVSAGPSFLLTQIRDEQDGIRSGWRTGYGASALLGLKIGRAAFVETRYSEFSKIRGLDLSGAEIGAGFRIQFR